MEEKRDFKIDLTEIQIKDLNETVHPISDLHKVIGNLLFTKAETIEVSDIARALHKGEVIDITLDELKEVAVIIGQNQYYRPWVHSQIIKYFTDKIPFENEEGAE